ncbi:MAG: hypothetical protein U1D41_01735 [Nitrosomonas sp.]|uniref:hypothetical protein n=1 Tax=Nitrosomonas sp. TaxID=42353 RepID=UPI00275057D5|nr:hypothetical protein [Nitrosomonas sp.]MDP1933676.1 hypothetical protein [Nitrosomonas sp.]MDP3146339.1 hypothetical protein [Bacteroidota bacterium]MDZ4104880.1 hypothetical protein [Nitrosomonas sp.]
MSPEFLNKLSATIEEAEEQIPINHGGLIFIVINFDDLFGEFSDNYKEQISDALESNRYPEIHVRDHSRKGRINSIRINKPSRH